MFAAALAINPDALTQARALPWKATKDEQVAVFRAMERYAHGDVTERVSATDDMDRIITRIVARACEEITRK